MLNLQKIEIVISIMILSFVSIFSIVVNGSFQSFISKIFGDDTPYLLNYRLFNPIIFLDPIPIFISILFHVTWFKDIPFNPLNIRYPLRYLKIFIIYIAQAISSFFISLIFMIILVYSIGMHKVILFTSQAFGQMAIFSNLGIKTNIYYLQNYSSNYIVLILILYYIAVFNISFFSLNLVYSIVRYIDFLFYGKNYNYTNNLSLKFIIIFLMISLIFIPTINIFVFKLIMDIILILQYYFNINII